MALKLDGNSKEDAHVRSNLVYLVWLRAVINLIFSQYAECSELPSNISTACLRSLGEFYSVITM